MKNPRKLLWFLLPAALGIVSVSIGFSAYQINHIEKNDGTVTESLYSVKFHLNIPSNDSTEDSSSSSSSSSITRSDITFEGLEYTSGLDLIVLPNEWNDGYTFSGWCIGTETASTGGNPFTKDVHVNELLSAYSSKLSDNIIHLWANWITNAKS